LLAENFLTGKRENFLKNQNPSAGSTDAVIFHRTATIHLFGSFLSNNFINPVTVSFNFFKREQVTLKNSLGLDTILQAPKMRLQNRRHFLGKGIDHPVVMSAGFNQAVLLHAPEMLGNLDLGTIQDFLDMADAK
jgi:hypothetical protein